MKNAPLGPVNRPTLAKPPRWRRRSSSRPSEILSAALEVFVERGVSGGALDEIARRAGISKTAIYLYYKNKQEVYGALLRSAVVPSLKIVAGSRQISEGHISEYFPTMLGELADIAISDPFASIFRLAFTEPDDFPATKVFREEAIASMTRDVAVHVEKAQARGELRDGDSQAYSMSLISPILLQTLIGNLAGQNDTKYEFRAIVKAHVRTVLFGIGTRSK